MASIRPSGWWHYWIDNLIVLPGLIIPRLLVAFKSVSRAASLIVVLTGCVVLVGWVFDSSALKSVLPGLATMKVNTALAFVLSGASLWLLNSNLGERNPRFVSRAFAAMVLLIGLVTLGEYLFLWNLGIDELLFTDHHHPVDTISPGRMSPATAFNFALTGTALLLMHKGPRRSAQLLAIAVNLISLLALVGYLYNAKSLYSISPYSSMAVHTAAAFMALSLSLLFAHPGSGLMAVITGDTIGGIMARRLLPAALGLPVLIGWVRLAGQRAGFYDTEFGLSMMVLSVAILLASLIFWNAASLHHIDLRRKKAMQSLIESETKYHDLYNNAADMYLSVDAATARIIQCNETLCEATGYSRKEILGRPIFDLYHPDCMERVKKAIHQFVTTGEVKDAELQLKRKDGSIIEVSLNASAVRDDEGRILRSRSSLRDITERKRAEAARQAAEERYRDLFENANDIIYIHDLEGNFTTINQTAERLIGYSRDEIAGMNLSQIIAPDYQEFARKNTFDKVVSRSESAIYGLEIVCKDGHRLPVEVSSRLIYEDGRAAGVQSVARDVSERRHLEEQLRQSQKMEAVGRLAGGVAHDFNNLLTAIIGYGHVALSRLDKNHQARDDIEEVKKAGERAAALTGQLLAFSRRQAFQPRAFSLNASIENMEKMLRRLIGEDIELVTRLDLQLGRVIADPAQIDQVIINLAVNARDAMPRGGKLTIEAKNIYLDRSYFDSHIETAPGQYVLLAVSDNGMGMDRETLSHIFEPFFTTKEEGKGTGLGLSTVYGIVRQNGGNVEVYSESGNGTTFNIYLPLAEETVRIEKPSASSAESLHGSETILVVEDEASVRALARLILEGNGYKILEASSGAEALTICQQREEEIALMLTDVVMPQMSGRELAEKLAAVCPAMKILYMSGYTDDAIINHGIPGADSFVSKPFSLETLARKVREALDA